MSLLHIDSVWEKACILGLKGNSSTFRYDTSTFNMCFHSSLCGYVCLCAFVCDGQRTTSDVPSMVATLLLGSLSLTWSSPIRQGCLTREFGGSYCLYLSNWAYKYRPPCLFFFFLSMRSEDCTLGSYACRARIFIFTYFFNVLSDCVFEVEH